MYSTDYALVESELTGEELYNQEPVFFIVQYSFSDLLDHSARNLMKGFLKCPF